jgi:hypothetical protein
MHGVKPYPTPLGTNLLCLKMKIYCISHAILITNIYLLPVITDLQWLPIPFCTLSLSTHTNIYSSPYVATDYPYQLDLWLARMGRWLLTEASLICASDSQCNANPAVRKAPWSLLWHVTAHCQSCSLQGLWNGRILDRSSENPDFWIWQTGRQPVCISEMGFWIWHQWSWRVFEPL